MSIAAARLRSRLRAEAREDEDNPDRWVLSYADFITLLFAFFVVMYSISSVNDGKFRALSESMATVFQDESALPAAVDLGGGMPGLYRSAAEAEGGAPARVLEAIAMDDFPVPVAAVDPRDLRSAMLARRVEQVLKGAIEMKQVNVRQSEDWTEVELDSEFMFDSGQARMKGEAKALIERVARLLKATDTPVRVEGFTDNVPLSGGIYASNWELSAARAGTVADAFARAGVEPSRLSATGFGELYPVADNATAAGRRRNRRVVVAIARHGDVPEASVTAGAGGGDGGAEELPLRALRRVTRLPGPAVIAL